MKNEKSKFLGLTPQEMKLLAQLREHPEMMARFETILAISSTTDGPIKRADEIEDLLIAEMRRLGNTTMGTWAAGAEERLVKQFKEAHPSARARKKNAEVVRRVRGGERHRTDLEDGPKIVCAPVGSGHWREAERTISAAQAGVD